MYGVLVALSQRLDVTNAKWVRSSLPHRFLLEPRSQPVAYTYSVISTVQCLLVS